MSSLSERLCIRSDKKLMYNYDESDDDFVVPKGKHEGKEGKADEKPKQFVRDDAIVLMAFDCPHCNERNNEVQFAGQLQPKGCSYKLEVTAGDSNILNRQVVKSDSATIKIPELDFEIPPEAQRGTLSTFGENLCWVPLLGLFVKG